MDTKHIKFLIIFKMDDILTYKWICEFSDELLNGCYDTVFTTILHIYLIMSGKIHGLFVNAKHIVSTCCRQIFYELIDGRLKILSYISECYECYVNAELSRS